MTGISLASDAPTLPSTDLTSLCAAILDALDKFDQQTLPLGLYACEEYRMKEIPFPRLYQEWMLCLAPCLKELGFDPSLPNKPGSPAVRAGDFWFRLPDRRNGYFSVARTSKIKVRKYGSAYRIEPHLKFGERWDELNLDLRIPELWKPSSIAEGSRVGLRLFLFVGFAKEADPFGNELSQLEEQLEWNQHSVEYHTRLWSDRQDRAFFVRLSLWASAISDPKASRETSEGGRG